MLFADVTFSTEAMVVIGMLVGGLVAAITALFKMLMAEKDASLKAMESHMISYKEIGEEAISAIETVVRDKNIAGNKPIPLALVPVVPEHSSPVTKKQQEDADLQTMRARLTAAILHLGLPVRKAAEPEKKSILD